MNQNQAIEQARQAKEQHQKALLKLANVVGIGIGLKETGRAITDQIAVIVNVLEKKPISALLPDDIVPTQIDNVVTDVQETGPIKAL